MKPQLPLILWDIDLLFYHDKSSLLIASVTRKARPHSTVLFIWFSFDFHLFCLSKVWLDVSHAWCRPTSFPLPRAHPPRPLTLQSYPTIPRPLSNRLIVSVFTSVSVQSSAYSVKFIIVTTTAIVLFLRTPYHFLRITISAPLRLL